MEFQACEFSASNVGRVPQEFRQTGFDSELFGSNYGRNIGAPGEPDNEIAASHLNARK
jgi:hypothetical protein